MHTMHLHKPQIQDPPEKQEDSFLKAGQSERPSDNPPEEQPAPE